MKRLFFSVAIVSAVMACSVLAVASGGVGVSTLAADGIPDKEWIDKAERGNAEEQFRLGMWHESQLHYDEAAKWFHKAAEQGNIAAQYHLGVLCENGQGVEKDYKEAVKWYLSAAEHGNIPAQERLGVLFENGFGVPQNKAEAYMRFYIAAVPSDREAAKHARALEKTLTPEQVAQGQRMAREWMQQHPKPALP